MKRKPGAETVGAYFRDDVLAIVLAMILIVAGGIVIAEGGMSTPNILRGPR